MNTPGLQQPIPPPPVAPPGSPEMQVAQAGADLTAATTPAYAGGTPQGALASTPDQGAADQLNSGEALKGVAGVEGDVNAKAAAEKAAVHQATEAEHIAQAQDAEAGRAKRAQELEEADAGHAAAYAKYKASAGTLKDPETQYYEDKGQGVRIENALAAFASGIGAGFNGNSGNPVLEMLQKKFQSNYEAHRQNIDDLYRSSVEAGKIADTKENRARFDLDSKRASFELQGLHEKDRLAAIEARASSPLAKLAARKTIEGLNQEQSRLKQELAAKHGAAAAAAGALARARQAEVRGLFKDAYDKNIASGLDPDAASAAATKFIHSAGFNASETAPIFEANGVTTNPQTGEPVFPAAKSPTGPDEPTYDADGKLQVPVRDPQTGKTLKPEERKAITDEARKRTVIVDGKPQLAVSEEAAKKYAGIQGALPEADRLVKTLKDAWAKGDKGAYDQARNQLIEISPVIYGFTRGPSAAQAGETGGGSGDHGGEASGTIAGQIPEFQSLGVLGTAAGFLTGSGPQASTAFANTHPLGKTTSRGIATSKLDALQTSIGRIAEDAHRQAFGGAPESQAAAKPQDVATAQAQLAAKSGWKALP